MLNVSFTYSTWTLFTLPFSNFLFKNGERRRIFIFFRYYNPGHNILKLYNILVKIRFTTSKTKFDAQYSKLGTRVASRVAERLETQDLRELGDIRKFLNLSGHIAQCLVSLHELRLYQWQLKITQKQIPTKFFFSCPVLLDYSILFQIFCPGLQTYKQTNKNVADTTFNWRCITPYDGVRNSF